MTTTSRQTGPRPEEARKLTVRYGAGTAVALVLVPAFGALALGLVGRIGAGGLLAPLPWAAIALGLWAGFGGLLGALDRWTPRVGPAFERAGWPPEARVAAAWNLLNLLALGAGLLFLAALARGGPLFPYQLASLALIAPPAVARAGFRLRRIARHELAGEPLPSPQDPPLLGPRWLVEVLVLTTCVLLTPFVGSAVAAGGIWSQTSGLRRAAVPAMIVGGFLITALVLRDLFREPTWHSDGPRLALYVILALASGSTLLLVRRAVLASHD